MNLQQANQRAKYLTELTKIPHIVTKTNKEYYVFQKENWKGTVEKTYNYEDIKQPEKEDKSKDLQTVSGLLDAPDKKVLPSDRTKRHKISSKNG